MTLEKPNPSRDEGVAMWNCFVRRNRGHRLLNRPILYALTTQLVEEINRRLPSFFSPEDLKFETDLAATVHLAFALGRATDRGNRPISGRLERALSESSKKLDHLVEQSRLPGPTDKRVRSKAPESLEPLVKELSEAYRGWLFCNPCFGDELKRLQAKWGTDIASVGHFPWIPQSFFPTDARNSGFAPKLLEEFTEFYMAWGIDTLLTWDWPLPMRPELGSRVRQRDVRFSIADLCGKKDAKKKRVGRAAHPSWVISLSDAGAEIFIPWPMLAGGALGFKGLAMMLRADCPEHIHPWLDGRLPSGTRIGQKRLKAIAFLYRYLFLALLDRYPDQCRRNLERLDRVFATRAGSGIEEGSVRRLRYVISRCRALAVAPADA